MLLGPTPRSRKAATTEPTDVSTAPAPTPPRLGLIRALLAASALLLLVPAVMVAIDEAPLLALTFGAPGLAYAAAFLALRGSTLAPALVTARLLAISALVFLFVAVFVPSLL